MRKIIVYLLILLVFLTSGCYSFRKKFVRKKKQDKEPPIYVSFKDYPEAPSRDAYVTYYTFAKGWLDELLKSLDSEFSFKRQRRAINETIMNLEQIISFYNQEGKNAIYPLYAEFTAVKKEIEKNPNMSQMKRNALAKKIEHLKRTFEKDFSYSDTEKWLKTANE